MRSLRGFRCLRSLRCFWGTTSGRNVLQSLIMRPTSSVTRHPSSVFRLPSSVFRLPSSVFHHLPSKTTRKDSCGRA
ncbi:MAG: hypothetical protein EP346_02680 [Bacteroidetes bacterium]|nr:MAG: hypothetical protein EP346_02680 [Bacteroidota bacterium]